MIKTMSNEDEKISYMLHKILDDPNVDQETKIDIIKWFDQFEYLENKSIMEIMLLHAQNMKWD